MFTIVDPSLKEELILNGKSTFTMTIFEQVCAINKIGGIPLTSADLVRLCYKHVLPLVRLWHTQLENEFKKQQFDNPRKRKEFLHGRIVNPVDLFDPLIFKTVPSTLDNSNTTEKNTVKENDQDNLEDNNDDKDKDKDMDKDSMQIDDDNNDGNGDDILWDQWLEEEQHKFQQMLPDRPQNQHEINADDQHIPTPSSNKRTLLSEFY